MGKMEKPARQKRIEAVRNSKAFDVFVIFVILVAAIAVGAKTFDISPFAHHLIGILERLVTLIFIIELTIRFLATRPRFAFFKNIWNIFDAVIVAISLIPVEGSDTALVARLARVFQTFRMVGVMPEVRLLLNSLLKAIPKLIYVMVMMAIIFYIYGAIGSLFFEAVDPLLWGNVAASMLTLFQVMTFDDWAEIMHATMDAHWWSWAYYLSFIFLTAFAFLNMIIGIIVNVLEEENEQVVTADPNKISNENLYQEMQKIKRMLRAENQGPNTGA